MNEISVTAQGSGSPLEQFLRDYVETMGGEWDELEPQVYDVMLPDAVAGETTDTAEPQIVRITFDPEALAEHTQAQLASLGTPLVDRMLRQAVERARFVELYVAGLNLQTHQLAARVARALSLEDQLTLEIGATRILDFPQLVFWFEATFLSDQREQEIVPTAINLHYGRQVRHLDELLDTRRLLETPPVVYPMASGITRAAAYRLAREQVVRSVTALANVRSRELLERLDKQVARMNRYYADLEHELDQQAARAATRGAEEADRYRTRREVLQGERQLRIAELRKKNSLQVRLRLLHVLLVHQPKLLIQSNVVDASAARRGAPPAACALRLVWDPLVESLEAVACPGCGRPTFELRRGRQSPTCAACASTTPPSLRSRPR